MFIRDETTEASEKKPAPLRVGRVRYLNCEPVYYAIERGLVQASCRLVDGTPTELNDRLRSGELDLSVISALEYASHPGCYLLLPDLAIACDGAVDSVLFLSRVPPEELHQQKILLTRKSLTARALLKLLLAKGHGVVPEFVDGEVEPGLQLPEGILGALLIGDEALRAKAQGVFPYQLDLGASWKALTGMAFVFAVWAVRRECYAAYPGAVHALHQALLASKAWSLGHLEAIAQDTYSRAGLRYESCLAYLKERLSFDLTQSHLDGLRFFLTMLTERGELQPFEAFQFIGAQNYALLCEGVKSSTEKA